MISSQRVANLKSDYVEPDRGNLSRESSLNQHPLPQMFEPLTLWHVTCGHSDENGCYGYESANNENAPGNSGPCRNHPSAPAAPEARSFPYSIALARQPYHCSKAEANHRRRYARAAGYPASCKDHAFAPSSGTPGFAHYDRHHNGDTGRFLARIYYSLRSRRLKVAHSSSSVRLRKYCNLASLIEDRFTPGWPNLRHPRDFATT